MKYLYGRASNPDCLVSFFLQMSIIGHQEFLPNRDTFMEEKIRLTFVYPDLRIIEMLKDKTIDDHLMYTPHYNKQN